MTAFKLEWNPNTVLILLGLAGTFVTWGYSYSQIHNRLDIGAQQLVGMQARLERLEADSTQLKTHDLRITRLEQVVVDRTAANEKLNVILNDIQSRLSVSQEILKRLEDRK